MPLNVADPGIPASPTGIGLAPTDADRDLVARAIADAIPPTGFPRDQVARRTAIDAAAAELAERLSSDEDFSEDRP